MYSLGMLKISVMDVCGQFFEFIECVCSEVVFVECCGKVEVVFISFEQYVCMFDVLEDVEDVFVFDEVMVDEGDNIFWVQVKVDLGWE